MSDETFHIIDIEALLRERTLPIVITKKFKAEEFTSNNFSNIIFREDSLTLRNGTDIGIIREDGSVRILVRKRSLNEARKIYEGLLNIAKKIFYSYN